MMFDFCFHIFTSFIALTSPWAIFIYPGAIGQMSGIVVPQAFLKVRETTNHQNQRYGTTTEKGESLTNIAMKKTYEENLA